MQTVIALILTRGTGPARSRRALRRQTRRVRMYRDVFQSLDGVRCTLPRNVLGGDLVDLLSDRLRAALQEGTEPAFVPGSAVASRPSLPTMTASSGPRELSDPLRAGPGPIDPLWPGGGFPRTLPAARLGDPALSESAPGDRRFHPPPGNGHTGTIGKAAGKPSPTRRRSPASGERPAANRQRESPAPTVIARKLDEYWRTTVAPDGARAPTSPSPAENAQRAGPVFQELLGGPREARSWPEMTGQELAKRIAAFTSGQEAPPPPEPARSARPSDGQAEVQNIFHIAVNAHNAGSMRDLSDQVADILREQAVHHGIDIT